MSIVYLSGVIIAGFLIGLLIAIMEINNYIKPSEDRYSDGGTKAFTYIGMVASIFGSYATVGICLGALTVIGIKYSIDHKEDDCSCGDDCNCSTKDTTC